MRDRRGGRGRLRLVAGRRVGDRLLLCHGLLLRDRLGLRLRLRAARKRLTAGKGLATRRGLVDRRVRLGAGLRGRLHGRHDLTSVIGSSEAMRQVCEAVSRAAPTGTPVLFEVEARTVKEFLARTLHHS